MWIDSRRTRRLVSAIVARLTTDWALQEELVQEALIRLWLQVERRPGQSESWYLHGCKLHLLNYIKRGRSVDSPRHSSKSIVHGIADQRQHGDSSHEMERLGTETAVESEVCARDMIAMLMKCTDSLDKEILGYLAEGYGVREIGRKLGISHVAVLKHRRCIAAAAIKLNVHRKETEETDVG